METMRNSSIVRAEYEQGLRDYMANPSVGWPYKLEAELIQSVEFEIGDPDLGYAVSMDAMQSVQSGSGVME